MLSKDDDIKFLYRAFREYYYRNIEQIQGPPQIEAREIGYLPFEGTMVRHIGVRDLGELRGLILHVIPKGIFTSVAYYTHPSLPINEKGFTGADLFIDIDADMLDLPCKSLHDFIICQDCLAVQGADSGSRCLHCSSTNVQLQKWTCETCIKYAKREVEKALKFMSEDLGFSKQSVSVYFSGHRGFHLLVASDEVQELGQQERAELLDYFLGRGISITALGFRENMNEVELQQLVNKLKDDGGWRARLFQNIREQDLISAYKSKGLSGITELVELKVRELRVNLDPVVTGDIHRLVRLDRSLHEDTGLIKMKCEDVVNFDPFSDAVVFDDEPYTNIYVLNAPTLKWKGLTYKFPRKTNVSVPKGLAVYLICKQAATLVNKTSPKTL